MQIVEMEVFPVRLTLKDPVPMANGVISSTGNVLVRLTSDEGIAGWGEGVEAPALTGQHQADIVADLSRLQPLVLGSDPARITDLWARLHSARPNASTARGAIDIAVHDLMGKAYGVPVSGLLGGVVRDRVPALTLVGSGDHQRDIARLEMLREQGLSWFKIKLGMAPAEVEWRTLRTAVDLVDEHGAICGDANEAWTEDEAARFLGGLADSGVRFIEQPVSREDPGALLRVAADSPVAICADESAGSLEAVLGFAGSQVGGVSLKLIKHGGITGVMRGAVICATGGLEVNLAGKVIESSISAAANLHCAAAMESVEYGCSPANREVIQDVTDTSLSVTHGEYIVPVGPGLGVEVDEDLVRRLSV